MGVLLVVQRGEVLTEAAQQTCCRAVSVRVTYVTLLCDSTVTEHKNRTGEDSTARTSTPTQKLQLY
jgi:hypothetical protein